jgi:ATP-dependent helicase/DNAse subunit B
VPAVPADAVLIAEPLSIRARRFRVVLVGGLCDGEFPATEAPDPFLDDAHRRELALASGLVLSAGEDQLARERYLLYSSVSRATERVVLSYRSSDEEGRAVAPSPFIDDVAQLFVPEWRSRRRRRLLADLVWSPELAPTERERRYACGAAAMTDPGVPPPAAARQLGQAALRHVRHREVVSGGALELFAACPVKWLIERQLEPRELAPEADPLARGNFMHDVLERLIGALEAPVTPASLERASRLAEELTAELPPGLAAGRPPAVRAAIRRGIVADLHRYLAAEAADGFDWTPHALELRFGFEDEDGDLPAVVLSSGEERVRLRGMIDRVDVEPTARRRAIVRDYKSGANRPERAANRWIADHQLQVGLYMIAARRLLGLEPVAGFYQPLTGRELRPRGAKLAGADVCGNAYSTDELDAAALDELLEGVERDAVTLAAALRAGVLTPCPATCSRDGCSHPGICWAG